MFRTLIKRHYYTTEGRRIVEILRKKYEQKKLEHLNTLNHVKKNDIYGLGYTSPNEV